MTVLTDEELEYLKGLHIQFCRPVQSPNITQARGRKYTEFAGVKHVHVKGTFYGASEKQVCARRLDG